MELSANAKIQNRYQILSLIDKGGMGEVYLAVDSQLGRKVALKLLKKTDDPDKVKRFRQEAKIISQLNHPNILTIYDFGQHKDFHFIISELVEGETLRKFTTSKNLSLIEVLDITIQIGNALIAAHKSKIIHRDLKPENVMMSSDDNHVKVLDFGLAKFTDEENNLTQKPDETTASVFHTKEGLVAGTVYYMSPEQLRGHPVDERTDIWSLGVVFFELLTKQRPFREDNSGDLIVSILERSVPSIAAINPELPVEIENVITKALAKKKEDRFQTVKEFADALKNIKGNIESIEFTGVESRARLISTKKTIAATDSGQETITQSLISYSYFSKDLGKTWKYFFAFILFIALTASGLFYFYAYSSESIITKQIKVKRLPTAGNITNGVISPDGRFVAFVQTENGKQSLWLRLVDEVAGKELVAASPVKYSGLTFSPDGNSIFFTSFADKASGMLYRIPILGGNSQKIISDVDSTISFSPDGNRFAFIRVKSSEGINQIIVSNIDGSAEQIISERKQPEFYSVSARESLAWSPDAKFIACPVGRKDASGEFMNLAEININDGKATIISNHKWFRIGKILWSQNYGELLITASETASMPFQIVKIYQSTGKVEFVTNDLSDYLNLSVTADSKRLLGLIFNENSNIFTLSLSSMEQSRQLSGGGFDGIGGLNWTSDGNIVFVSIESGNRDIWQMDSTGANRRQLTFDTSSEDFPIVSKDGKYIIFVSDRAGAPHIWRMNSDGTNLKQLTGSSEETFPQITPDGNWIIYSARSDGRWVLWKTSIDGDNPMQLAVEQTHWASISPDGKTIACLGRESVADAPIRLVLISFEDGKVLARFNLTGEVAAPGIVPILKWTADNQAVAYISTQDNISNIFMQSIKGGDPKKITNFSADRIFSFDWSKDGNSIAFSRGVMRSDLVLMENF